MRHPVQRAGGLPSAKMQEAEGRKEGKKEKDGISRGYICFWSVRERERGEEGKRKREIRSSGIMEFLSPLEAQPH